MELQNNINFINIFPKEIIIEIFEYLSLYNLITLANVNKYLNDFIKNNKWNHLMVRLKKVSIMKYLIHARRNTKL